MEDFSERLQRILSHLNLTSSQFADIIGVPRSSLSHIISGRNNPSLDFIIKIRDAYPKINLYWLIYGFEPFLLDAPSELPTHISDEEMEVLSQKSSSSSAEESVKKDIVNQKNEDYNDEEVNIPQPTIKSTPSSTEEEKIIILYNDGTFKSYRQQ